MVDHYSAPPLANHAQYFQLSIHLVQTLYTGVLSHYVIAERLLYLSLWHTVFCNIQWCVLCYYFYTPRIYLTSLTFMDIHFNADDTQLYLLLKPGEN